MTKLNEPPSSRQLEREVHELFLKSLDGQLSAAEAARFGELIASSDEAWRRLLECSMVVADLKFHASGMKVGAIAAGDADAR